MEAVCLPVGSEFKVNVYDAFGDGMCGSCYGGVDGNLLVSNLCGDELYYVGDTTQYESIGSEIIVVDACVPPVLRVVLTPGLQSTILCCDGRR